MSIWSYAHGSIEVQVPGRTQAEVQYVLDTVLSHLPVVCGSEEDMDVHPVQLNGFNSSSSYDEFLEKTNNLVDRYGKKNRDRGSNNVQTHYLIAIHGNFRDTTFTEAYRQIVKWLIRLSARVRIVDTIIKVWSYDKSTIIHDINLMNNYDYDSNWANYLRFEPRRDEDGCLLSGKPETHRNKKGN